MRIPLKDDFITNITDSSWSESNRSEYTDFGDTVYTDLTFEFENSNDFNYKSESGYVGSFSFNVPGLSAFEITVWLIENAERIKHMTEDEFKLEIDKLSGNYYKKRYKNIASDIRLIRNRLRGEDYDRRLVLVVSGDALDIYELDPNKGDYRGQ